MMRAPVTGSFLPDSQLVCLSPYWCHSPKWSGIGFPTTESICTCKKHYAQWVSVPFLYWLFKLKTEFNCGPRLNHGVSNDLSKQLTIKYSSSLFPKQFGINKCQHICCLEKPNKNRQWLSLGIMESTPKSHKSNTSNHPSNTNQSFPT